MTSTLDEAIAAAMAGGDRSGFIPVFLAAEIVVPSGSPVGEDLEGFQPLLYDRDGTPMLAVFSNAGLAKVVSGTAPFTVRMTGGELVRRMPAGNGIVVNPGHAQGFDMAPDGVAGLAAELSAAGVQDEQDERDVPVDALDEAITTARAGGGSSGLVPTFLVADLVVPSVTEVAPGGGEGFTPVLYERDGTPMLAVCSSFERAKVLAGTARFAVRMTGRDLVLWMRPGDGIVVNPGHPGTFELSGEGVERLRADLSA